MGNGGMPAGVQINADLFMRLADVAETAPEVEERQVACFTISLIR